MPDEGRETTLCEVITGEFHTHSQWCMNTATGSVDCDDAWCSCGGSGHWVCHEHGGEPTPPARETTEAQR